MQSRSVRNTALIFCEGAHDRTFIQFLIAVFAPGRGVVSFQTRQGRGGSADGLVLSALKVPGDFNSRLVKLDKDRDVVEIERAIQIARREGLILNFSVPCLDAMLLNILNPGTDYSKQSSTDCKQEFEKGYIQQSKRTDPSAYRPFFNKGNLTAARSRISELNELISFIETGGRM